MDNGADHAATAPDTKSSRRLRVRRLLKIIGVLFLIGIFIGLAFPCLNRGRETTPQVMIKIAQFHVALDMYRTEYGVYPGTTENRRIYNILNGKRVNKDNSRQLEFMSFRSKDTNSTGEVVDPWGTPYRFQFDERGPLVTSAGPDKRFGTADDITNRQ